MVRFTKEIDINAPRAIVWNTMMDVANWHRWTPTIIRIENLNTSKVEVGTKLLIEQPKLAKAVWKVFQLMPQEDFLMKKGNLFLNIIAVHRLLSSKEGTSVILSLEFSGLFGNLVAKKYQQMMEAYLAAEADGLKKTCEEQSRVPATW